MKRFFGNITLFFLFAGVLYVFSTFMWGYYKYGYNQKMRGGHTQTRLTEAQNHDGNLDVLFLGSSHTYRGFDPRNFEGLKTFNLGSSSQTPLQTHLLLTKFWHKLNPRLVVYEVYPETFVLDGVESSLDIILKGKNGLATFKMACLQQNIKVFNTFLYAFVRDLWTNNQTVQEPAVIGVDSYISGGYVEREMQYFKTEAEYQPQKWTLSSKQVKQFEKTESFIKDKKVPLVLVYAPITQSLYDSYANNTFIDSLMTSYGFDYYNFNEIMRGELHDSLHFYDKHHLNQDGVNLFNRKLKQVTGW